MSIEKRLTQIIGSVPGKAADTQCQLYQLYQTAVGGDQLCNVDLLAGRFHVAAHPLGLQRAFTGTLGGRRTLHCA